MVQTMKQMIQAMKQMIQTMKRMIHQKFFRFCFKCGNSYHAPTDCDTIKRFVLPIKLWLK